MWFLLQQPTESSSEPDGHITNFFFYWEFAGWPHHKGTSLTCEDLASAVEMALKMLLLSSTCSSLGSKLSSLASNVAERAWISKISEPVNNVVIWSEQSDTLQQYRDVLNLSSWYGCTCHHCLVSINGLGWRKGFFTDETSTKVEIR